MKKLHLTGLVSSARGETLVETLAGVLVCVLASVVLATGIVTASRINASAEQAAEQLRADQNAAAQQSGGTLSGKVATVTVAPTDESLGSGETFTVKLYGGDEIASYDYAPATGGDPIDSGDSGDGEGGGD